MTFKPLQTIGTLAGAGSGPLATELILATELATKLLGQNTPAIYATEYHYIEMWA